MQLVLGKRQMDVFAFTEPNAQQETPAMAGTHPMASRISFAWWPRQGTTVEWANYYIWSDVDILELQIVSGNLPGS